MTYFPLSLLVAALASLAAGAALMFVGDAVDGVRFTGLAVSAGGVVLLYLWARLNGRRTEAVSSPLAQDVAMEISRKQRRYLRNATAGGGLLLVAAGLVQGFDGHVFHRGTGMSRQDAAGAWFVGGSLVAVGLMSLAAGVLLRDGPSGRRGEKGGPSR